ncbi:MAG TPA: ABC transporter permease [Candidatus Methylomirabilis sp.]|nr:ABC transporter permease [Candidatus Methylomirabilis sp.]
MRTLKVYVLKRVLQSIPLILFVMAINFLIIHAAPGDPITYLYGASAEVSAEQMDRLREELGLTRPLHVQYVLYLRQLLRGDLGFSVINRRPVLDLILERIPPTLVLMSSAFVFSVIVGGLWGVISAVKARTQIDYWVTIASLFGYSMPTFWLGLVLIMIFSLQLGWFPTMGMVTLGSTSTGWSGLADVLRHLVLPTITLGMFYLAIYARLIRASMLEVLGQEFITTAWSKGLPARTVHYKHALKNALLPVITIAGLQIGFMFTGAVLTETIFAWPGMGGLTYQAILQRDYALLMGLFLLVSVCVILTNLATDLLYTLVDPRIRYSAS